VSWLPPALQPQIRGHLLREEGEVIVDEVAHHWICYVRPALTATLGAAVALLALVVDTRVGWFFILAGGGLLAIAAFRALSVHMDRFVVTNMRVFRVQGVLSQSLATMPLRRILDITVIKPFSGRMLGYGDFVFESAAQEQGLREIKKVGRVDERDLVIQRVVQRAGLRGPKVT
jgi:hypothetical protein